MPRPPENSFAAICDGRPDDQLAPVGNRLHSFAILQDRNPEDILALAARIAGSLGPNGLGKWSRRDGRYRARFAHIFASELRSTGLVSVYEATEAEMIACMDFMPQLLPRRAGFTITRSAGRPLEVSAHGTTRNANTGVAISPRAPWNVGVVVTWSSLAVAAFYADAQQSAERLGFAPPTMILLPDRFPLENSHRPGATSLMRALLHYQLDDRIEQACSRPGEPDSAAEVLIDNIVGLFNQRHEQPDDEVSQVAFLMLNDASLRDHLLCRQLNVDELRSWV